MSDARGKTYRPWDPQHYRHEAHSPEAKLPQDDLVFFVLDTVPRLDLSRFYAAYEEETRGAPPFAPPQVSQPPLPPSEGISAAVDSCQPPDIGLPVVVRMWSWPDIIAKAVTAHVRAGGGRTFPLKSGVWDHGLQPQCL